MELIRRTFRRSGRREDTYLKVGRKKTGLCWSGFVDRMAELFTIPIREVAGGGKLELSLHSRPAVDRVKMIVQETDYGEKAHDIMSMEDGSEWQDGSFETDRLLEPFAGRIVHLQLEYWE